jgi:hypothetical protein
VAIVGDSLTAAAAGFHRTELARAEMVGVVDGRNSRRITGDPLTSGVPTALKIRQEFGEADCWVIGLGTNDIYADATSVAASTRLIEQMLDVLSPYARVWWVNVGLRPIGDPPPDPLPDPVIVARAQWFNQALAQRAAWDGNFRVVDWAALSAANPTWWLDHVHVDRDGSRARAAQVAAAIAD